MSKWMLDHDIKDEDVEAIFGSSTLIEDIKDVRDNRANSCRQAHRYLVEKTAMGNIMVYLYHPGQLRVKLEE